jgi:serine/threonine-protein kinase
MAADRHLLFGLLALQTGLIKQAQLVAAFHAWTCDKSRSLADHLIALGHLDADRRAAVEALADVHVEAQDGDVEKSLAAVPAGRSTRETLARLADADIAASIGHLGAASPHLDDEADRTASYGIGTATSDGLRFRVLRPHARGGLGAVFVALDTELHREVALKQMLDQHADDPVSRQRFVVEAEVTGGLEHPGIVPVYGLGTYGGGRPYYAMRFIRGDSLKEAIDRFHKHEALKSDPGRRSLELRKLLRRFLDVCNAIDYAHSRGVLHRDIKPGNIIIGKHGETLVVDWGMAKVQGLADLAESSDEQPLVPSSASGTAETLPGSALGTPAYMSPEQARGDLDHLGPRSDVYSLGATLYCLLTSRPPVEADDVGAILRAVQRGEFSPPRKLDATIDRALEAVCLKAVSLQPEYRYCTPKALADDVERWMADEPVSAYREPPSKRAGRWARRHRPLVSGAAALLITAVVALSVSTVLINRERARADASFRQARQAVDEYFTRVSESQLLDVPGMQPLRKELLESARKYYQEFVQQRSDDRSVRSETAATLYRVAWISENTGSLAEAEASFRKAVALYERLARAYANDPKFRIDLAIAYSSLGHVLSNLDRLDEARAWGRMALALREALARELPSSGRIQHEVAKSLADLRFNAIVTGHLDEAMNLAQKARSINEGLVHNPPAERDLPSDLDRRSRTTESYEMELAADCYWVAYILNWQARGNEALRFIQESSGHWANVIEARPSDLESRGRGMVAFLFHAELLSQLGRRDEARKLYERLQADFESLSNANPAVPTFRSYLGEVENRLGSLLFDSDQPDEALRAHRRALALYEKLVVDSPQAISYEARLASTCREVAFVLDETQRSREALPYLERARAIRESFLERDKSTPWKRIGLAEVYLGIGRLRGGVIRADEGNDLLCRAAEILEQETSKDPMDWYVLARVQSVRSRVLAELAKNSKRLVEFEAERQRCADRAVESLRQAVAAGYKDYFHMKKDSDFDPLRQRADFRALVVER